MKDVVQPLLERVHGLRNFENNMHTLSDIASNYSSAHANEIHELCVTLVNEFKRDHEDTFATLKQKVQNIPIPNDGDESQISTNDKQRMQAILRMNVAVTMNVITVGCK